MQTIRAADLAIARYDRSGRFTAGRRAELDALRAMGDRDPSLGRIYEGHFNGVLLVALYGSAQQHARAAADVANGELFGVWNTQDIDPVTIETLDDRYVLHGAKTWASAADSVTRAMITARRFDGTIQLCLVPMDRARTVVDSSAWRPLGMRDSNSYRVDFDGVVLEAADLIGEPGDYERPPWFLGGSLRFAAVHAGIVERIVRETIGYAVARGRADDPLVRERIARLRIAANGCVAWLGHAEEAWNRYDADASPSSARAAVDASDMARSAIETAALDALERAIRTVGAHGMVEPLPFAGLFRDLHMYLRQPAPDATLLRVADAGITAFIAARSATIAESIGSSANASNHGDSLSIRSSVSPNGADASTSASIVRGGVS
jgi:alkylation response protein AidB-like acyl-CoA dehydrogenase